MSFEVQQSLHQEMSSRMEWQQHPLQMMLNPVFDNLVERGYSVSLERNRSIESTYKSIRERLIEASDPHVGIVGALGISGSGKSSALQGMYRVSLADEYLHESLRERGRVLDVLPVPFSLYAEAAKTTRVMKLYPDLAIDPNKSHGMYTEDEYRRISTLMQRDIERYIDRHESGKTTLILLEPSSPTAVPGIKSDEIEGTDRGLSPLYNLARFSSTRDFVDILAIESDPLVSEEVVIFRSKLNTEETDVFDHDVQVVFTDNNETSEGGTVDVSELSDAIKKRIQAFTRRVMAPPEAKMRSDNEVALLKERLKHEKTIHVTTDRRFFRLIQERLEMPDTRFHYLSNQHFQGRKIFDIDYFLHSLPVRNYPEVILPEKS